MNTPWRARASIAILTVAVLLGLRALLVTFSPAGADALAAPSRPDQSPVGPITGQYIGKIKFGEVVQGRYSDVLVTVTPVPSPTRPPVTLGTPTPVPPLPRYGGKVDYDLDLALQLQTTGCAASGTVCGQVILDRTLAYPQVAVIQATPIGPTPRPGETPIPAQPLGIGPRVSGTFDGTTLTLTSEVFSVVQAQERRIPTPPAGTPSAAYRAPRQEVERQFRLVGTVQENGKLIVGEYRETMVLIVDGLRGVPSTAIGQFTLAQPVFGTTPAPTNTPGPSASSTPTSTPPASPTPTATRTPLPTSTPTSLPTSTPTTPVGPSPTPTTPVGPSATPTTPVSPSPTPTTPVGPSRTPAPTVSPSPTATAPVPSGLRVFLPHLAKGVNQP